MKKLLMKLWDFLLGCLVLVLLVLSIPFILLSIPYKYLVYRRSHFFRDLRAPFKFWSVDNETFRIYELAKVHGLPIRYLLPRDPKLKANGWFVSGTTLLIHDLEGLFYEEQLGGWTVYPEDEEPLSVTIDHIRAKLHADHPKVPITDIRVLMEFDDSTDEEYRIAQNDPLFLLYSGSEQLLDALRKL